VAPNPTESAAEAAYAVVAALTFSDWVHRRTETITFQDVVTVHRETKVDFTVPEGDIFTNPQPDTVFLPVHILDRVDLRSFELIDEDGRALPNMTSEESWKVARLGLRTLLTTSWDRQPEELEEVLDKLVPPPAWASAGTAAEEVDECTRWRLLGEVLAGIPDPTKERLKGLILELGAGLMLLVPIKYEVGRRRLFRFSFDAANHPGQEKASSAGRAYRRLNRAMSTFGFAARQEDFEDLQVGWASSYHVEAMPPEEMWVADAVLELETAGDDGKVVREQRCPGIPGDGVPGSTPPGARHQPHFPVAGSGRGERGQLTLLIGPRRESLILPLFASAAIIATVLAFIPGHLAELDSQVLAGLLLLPFALVAYYVRSSEHRYVSMALRGVRLLAGLPVLAALTVLAMLGLHLLEGHSHPGDASYEVAVWSARVAALTATLILPALTFPTFTRILRPLVRRAQSSAKDWSAARRKLVAIPALTLLGLLAPAALGAVVWAIYTYVPV
jgi:hypothetical protein